MITLDTTSIDSGTDEIYSVERGSKVHVLLNGGIVLANGDIVHELIFGDFMVEPVVDNFDVMTERIKTKRELNGKATNHEIEL